MMKLGLKHMVLSKVKLDLSGNAVCIRKCLKISQFTLTHPDQLAVLVVSAVAYCFSWPIPL